MRRGPAASYERFLRIDWPVHAVLPYGTLVKLFEFGVKFGLDGHSWRPVQWVALGAEKLRLRLEASNGHLVLHSIFLRSSEETAVVSIEDEGFEELVRRGVERVSVEDLVPDELRALQLDRLSLRSQKLFKICRILTSVELVEALFADSVLLARAKIRGKARPVKVFYSLGTRRSVNIGLRPEDGVFPGLPRSSLLRVLVKGQVSGESKVLSFRSKRLHSLLRLVEKVELRSRMRMCLNVANSS